jgi:hypothetical protein
VGKEETLLHKPDVRSRYEITGSFSLFRYGSLCRSQRLFDQVIFEQRLTEEKIENGTFRLEIQSLS